MAKRKASVVQKDFALGAVRPDAIERDDTDLQNRSLQQAANTAILSTGAIENRPGSFYLTTVTGQEAIEIEPASGVRFILHLVSAGVEIYSEDGVLLASFDTATWTLTENLWVNNLGDTVLIGSQQSPIHALTYEDGAFSFGLLSFADGTGGSLNQPYYAFSPSISITPSALTGNITITADSDIFTQDYVGTRIRYVDREITITSVTDGQNAAGTVVTELPPTKDLTVDSVSGFQIGEAVEHSTLGGQGIITGIAGSVVTVLVTKFFTGFNGNSANLVGPNAKSNITANADASTPAATQLWDEQLISAARGYPGASSEHKGRVILNDFPQAPNVIAISAHSTINDFLVGTNDDDAIIDTISASKSDRILHAVSVEDLILLTSRGCYYQETRDGTAFTPNNFDPIRFDSVSASAVRPAKIHDAVIFTAANGKNVFAAILQGDIYKAWSLTPLSDYHNQNINSPVRMSATENDSDRPERFAFVINTDGSSAIMRWERGPAFPQDTVGWVPWTTDGSYLSFFMAFGKIHAIVERVIDGTTVRFMERFDETAQLDAATAVTGNLYSGIADDNGDYIVDDDDHELVAASATASHLAGETITVWTNDYDVGDFSLNDEGLPVDADSNLIVLPDGALQIGLPYTMLIEPWAKRSVEGYAGRREAQRIIRLTVMVQDTITFSMNGQVFGGYRVGEDLTAPPARRTEHVHFYIGDREYYQSMIIQKTRPGPFRMTGLTFKVQV